MKRLCDFFANMRYRRFIEFLLGLGKGKSVYYINGAETLPPPLDTEEEAAAIAGLAYDKSNCEKLIKHNLRLVVYISKKFDNTGAGIEDLISIGTIGLIKAVNTYKPEKNIKLATYASRCIENEILMYIRKNASHRGDMSIDEPLNVDWDGNELLLSDILGTDENSVSEDIEKSEEERTVREAVSALDIREREIIEMRYGLGGKREMTQKEVADKLGISQSYISRLEKKIIVRLKKQIAAKV
ncbi:MAG: RNA polymerase sporulation sigma factor SigE [Clostridiales bacterium]|nr:RNA polymerase sporulation sigma factor SigE [Clostridiales bacterium]